MQSKGIRQWPIKLITSPIMTNKIIPTENKWLKRLKTQLDKPTNQNLVKVPNIVKPTNKKTLL